MARATRQYGKYGVMPFHVRPWWDGRCRKEDIILGRDAAACKPWNPRQIVISFAKSF
jgi:hypothetical protein